MSFFRLEAKKTALVLIDLQNGVIAMSTAPYPASEVVQRSKSLAQSLRAKGGTVIYVRVDLADFLSLPVDAPHGDPNALPPPAIASELAQEAGFETGDLLITKRHWGAFAGTELEQELRSRGIKTVVLGASRPTSASNRLLAKAQGWASRLSLWKTPLPVSMPMPMRTALRLR